MHRNVWHPFTILKKSPDPVRVLSGEGIWLELDGGDRVADCISSWWVNLFGHAHPEMVEAIRNQAETLEHVIFANFTHQPAEQISETLSEMLPGDLNRVFFSDNGSTAVEVALKMAIQYWQNKGEKRQKFIAFEGSYHGDTFGAMSAGSRSVFSDVFSDHLFEVDFVEYPSTWQGDEHPGGKEDRVIHEIEELLKQNPGEYAGIIIEPLIQGAGGMNMCREEFLQKLHWVNRQFDTLLIFDEVMTGFGRTGDTFASRRAQVQPDLICLAKGLTGGFLPLSVTVASDRIYSAFESDDPMKTFWHGHSYTANPIGCAAAVTSMKLLAEHQPKFGSMEQKHRRLFDEHFSDHPAVTRFRVTGTVCAFDLETDGEEGYLNEIADEIKKECVSHGLLIRPLGNTVYLMPPYCITDDELEWVYTRLAELIRTAMDQ